MKFSIREVFLLTLVVAVCLGWWVDHRRAAKREAEWQMLFDDAMSHLAVRSAGEYNFNTPAGPVTVNRAPDPERNRHTREVIHICDWHYVPKDAFAADLLSTHAGDLSDAEIGQHYADHLATIEAVQVEQVEQIRDLIQQHGIKRVWIEGLTRDELPVFRTLVATVRDARKGDCRELRLRLGAPGQLLATGELEDVVPLDEKLTHDAASPLKDGQVVITREANEAREESICQRLIAENEPVSLIVLGAAHDLSNRLAGHNVKYTRAMPKTVSELLAENLK